MAYTEANIKIQTQDFTQRSYLASSDLSVVSVVDTPTGNYDETLISSVSEFVDEYLLGSEVKATDSDTVKNICKLLQTMPVRCIRAANTKIKSGINNKGEVIYTNNDYVPYEYSKSFTVKNNSSEDCYGFLNIVNAAEENKIASIKLDGASYSEDESSKFPSEDEGVVITLKSVEDSNGTTPIGINPIFDNLVSNSVFNKLSNIGISESSSSYVLYTYNDAKLDLSKALPSFVDSDHIKVSNLSNSTTVLEFSNSGTMSTGDYINLNGYSFYLQEPNKVFNTILPGVPVEVLTDESSSVSPSIFSLYLNDKIVTGNYSKPVCSNYKVSVTFNDEYKYVSGSKDFIDSLYLEELPILSAYSTGNKVISRGSRLIVSNVEYVEPTVLTVLKFEELGEDEELVPSSKITSSDLIDYYRGVTLVITDKNTLSEYSFPITSNGKKTITFNSNSIEFKVENYKSFSFEDTDLFNSLSKLYKFEIKYFNFYSDPTSLKCRVFNTGVNYPIANSGDNVKSYLISSDKITSPLALHKMYRAVSSAESTNPAITGETCDKSTIVLLNSAFKNVEFNIIGITKVTGKLVFRYTIPKDSINLTNLKNSYAIKIEDNVFYCGSFTSTDVSEVLICLDPNELSFGEFMEKFFQDLPSYYNCLSNNVDSFTLFNNSGVFGEVYQYTGKESIATSIDGDEYNYASELDSRFAVIANYTSSDAIFGMKLVKDDGKYTLTLRKKEEQVDYEVSFVKGTLNGYGINIYFDSINAKQNFCKFIDLNEEAKVEVVPTEVEFGAEIKLPTPGVSNFQSALNKMLLETGTYYDFIFTAGYDVAQYIKHASDIASKKYCQVMCAIPQGITDAATAVEFRNATGVDNYQVHFSTPYYHDGTIGEFDTMVSPAAAVLERYYANNNGQKSFAPLFWKKQGRLNISTSMTSSSGLEVFYDDLDDRNNLLSNQINVVKIDRAQNLCYINDQLTGQKMDSDLSEFNNVRMINVLAHTCDNILDGYIAQFNDMATRMNIVTVLNSRISEVMFASQQFKPNTIQVVCDETNNTPAVISRRELVVDVYIYFEGIIKKIKVYQKVMPLAQ